MQIKVDQVSLSYQKNVPVLDHISFSVRENEFIGIVGRAGSGKTTLLEVLGGFHQPDSGTVLYENEEIYQKRFNKLNLRRKVQMVFQFPENQFFETDVYNETAFGLKMLKLPEDLIHQNVIEALNMVGLDDPDILAMSPFALSGGQKRRLAAACAFAVQPELLLLDEPFSGLDAEGHDLLMASLKKAHQNGTTILMVSHDPDLLCEVSDRVIVLADGKIAKDGSPTSVYSDIDFCDQTGIGVPEAVRLSKLTGLHLADDLHYESFLKTLIKNISGVPS